MSDPAGNMADLERLAKSEVWQLIMGTLSGEMDKTRRPTAIALGIPSHEIAQQAIHNAAAYQTLAWVRDKMLSEMILRERKALNE